jgi:hypothetical protein
MCDEQQVASGDYERDVQVAGSTKPACTISFPPGPHDRAWSTSRSAAASCAKNRCATRSNSAGVRAPARAMNSTRERMPVRVPDAKPGAPAHAMEAIRAQAAADECPLRR